MEEFNDDDDFSDLYADVEVQASSAIGAMHGLTEMPPEHHRNFGNAIDDDELSENNRSATEREQVENGEIESAQGNGGIYEDATEYAEVVDEDDDDDDDDDEEEESGGGLTNLPLENEDNYESESEDDLNIVLGGVGDGNRQKNEEGHGNSNIDNHDNNSKKDLGTYEKNGAGIYGRGNCFNTVAYVSQRKYMGPQSVALSSSLKGNGRTRADWEDNGCGQLINGIPVVGRRANNLSLTRSRTILDVNIDSLQGKLWRTSRSDVTDFFNYGFDEDGWKSYCNNMDECRGQKKMANRISAPEFPRRAKQKYEVGSGHDENSRASYAKNIANHTLKKRESPTSKNCRGYHLSELPRGGSLAENYIGKHQQSSHERHSDDQDLKGDSHNSDKRIADHIVSQVHEPSKKGDSDVDAERYHPCFSSASEGDPPSLHRNEDPRVKSASKRGSRHTPIRAPVSLDLDKYGTVQISDSEEDDHRDVFYSDSDGAAQTSDDTNRKNASKMSNKVSSVVEPVSSQSRRGLHGMGFSSSPSRHDALINKDGKKNLEQSKKYSVSRVREFRELTTFDYHPSKESKHYGAKPSTRDDSYRERDRRPTREDLKPYGRSRRVHNVKTYLNDVDASYMFDGRGLNGMYKSRTSHVKQRAVPNFDSNEKDMPYCKRSESLFTYFGGYFPDFQRGPAYLKDQYWNINPRLRCEAGQGDGHRLIKNGNSFKKKRTRMEYGASEDVWYHNEKKHSILDMNPLNFEDSRKLFPKYSNNRRCNQFRKRGDDLKFRKKTGGYGLASPHDYHNDFTKEKYRRYMLSSDRDRGHFDHIYDHNMRRDRREIESPVGGNGRHGSPRNNSDYSWHIKNDENRRYVKHQPLPFHPYMERHAPIRGRFQGATATKSVAPERHLRSSWKGRHRGSGWNGSNNAFFGTSDSIRSDHRKVHHDGRTYYQQSMNTSNNNESIETHQDWGYISRRRNHEYSEELQWSEEEYKSRPPVDTMLDYEGPLYHLERISRNNRPEDEYASDHVADCIDEREVDRYRSELKTELDCSYKFDQSPNVAPPDRYVQSVQIYAKHQDSVDPRLVVLGEKSTRRTSEAEDAVYYGRYDMTEWNNDRELKSYEDVRDFGSKDIVLAREGKIDTKQSDKNLHHQFSDDQLNKFLDVEEGQIIAEEVDKKLLQCSFVSEDVRQINDVKFPEIGSNGNRVVEGLDGRRIQEIIEKMERRRERFNDPITLNMDPEKSSEHLANLEAETAQCKIGRPTRKRRWIGSS